MQPLAGTEFVVNGHSARQWGPALEAINAGMSPDSFASAIAAQRLSASVDSAAIAAAAAAGARQGIEAASITATVTDRAAAGLVRRGERMGSR